MKKSTFLLFVLLIATFANGQQSQNLQQKVKQMQATYSRFTMQTEHFYKMNLPLNREMQKNSILKNALAVQKLDSTIYQEIDTETEDWQNLWKDEYLYDAEMQNTAWIEQNWVDTANTWMESAKVELEFNEAGQVEVMNMLYPDETSGELTLQSRSVAHYNTEGRLDSVIHHFLESENTWIEEGRQVYHYNETGQLVQMDMTTTEEDEEGVYTQSMKFVYTYNDADLIATDSWYITEEEIDYLFSKTEYVYDEANKLIAYEDSILDFFTAQLERSSRTDIEYDAEGDVSVETYSTWDSVAEDWVADEKDEYTYNNTSFSEVIFPSYLQFWGVNQESNTFNYAVAEIVTSTNLDGEWSPTDRSLFYYSEGTATSAKEISEAQVLVYPNPATDNVTLTWNNYRMLSLEVYHLTGAKVIEKQVSSGMSVPVSTLKNGIYLFKLKNENETVYSGKLIKK